MFRSWVMFVNLVLTGVGARGERGGGCQCSVQSPSRILLQRSFRSNSVSKCKLNNSLYLYLAIVESLRSVAALVFESLAQYKAIKCE